MPRYFFNTRIGGETITDPVGEELRGADQAWRLAKAMILDLLREEGEHPDLLTASLIVTDDDGNVVLEFPFSEVLLTEQDSEATRH